MKQARADRHRREHAEYLARMRRATARPLASRRVGVRLAVGFLTALVGIVVTQLVVDGPWRSAAVLGGIAGAATLWVMSRRATSLVTETPDEVLDELHIRLRNVYYRDAYRVFGALVAVMLVALLFTSTAPAPAPDVVVARVPRAGRRHGDADGRRHVPDARRRRR